MFKKVIKTNKISDLVDNLFNNEDSLKMELDLKTTERNKKEDYYKIISSCSDKLFEKKEGIYLSIYIDWNLVLYIDTFPGGYEFKYKEEINKGNKFLNNFKEVLPYVWNWKKMEGNIVKL